MINQSCTLVETIVHIYYMKKAYEISKMDETTYSVNFSQLYFFIMR